MASVSGFLFQAIGMLRRAIGLSPNQFSNWLTVDVGIYKTSEACLAAMKEKDRSLNRLSKGCLQRVGWAQEEDQEEIVKILDRELGLVWTYTLGELSTAALAFGLYPCRAEVGPALCMQDADLPVCEIFAIFMEPILDLHGDPQMFSVVRYSDATALHVMWAEPKFRHTPGTTWVFSRRKPASAT